MDEQLLLPVIACVGTSNPGSANIYMSSNISGSFNFIGLLQDIDEAPPWTLSNGQVLPALGVIGGGGVGSRLLVLQEFN